MAKTAIPSHTDPSDKRRYVAEMFARIARRYDLMNTLMTGGQDRRWRSLAVRLIRPAEFSPEWANGLGLDVAAGTGELALTLAREGGLAGGVALDLCPEMLAVARDKAQHAASQSQGANKSSLAPISLVVADALHLPFADETFVCATVGFGVRNFVDLPQAFAEMRRVLKPGGRLACLELSRSPSNLFNRVFDLYFDRLVPIVGQLVAGDAQAYTYLPNSVKAFPRADELAALIRSAGFRDVRFRRLGLGTVAIHLGTK